MWNESLVSPIICFGGSFRKVVNGNKLYDFEMQKQHYVIAAVKLDFRLQKKKKKKKKKNADIVFLNVHWLFKFRHWSNLQITT